jgi:hypothetical protein
VFTFSVGSIRAHESVETKIVVRLRVSSFSEMSRFEPLQLVISLMNDDNIDSIRFRLPMHVGERYGKLPAAIEDAMQATPTTRVKIVADIQTSGRLESITSPSHPDAIVQSPYSTELGRPSRRRATVKFRSKAFLERDFELSIHAQGLDAPRCFAEIERNDGRHVRNITATLALQLVIIPRFALPPLRTQEYLFLVDRSGSMGTESGSRIEIAKETLVLLLRMLPAQGSMFNIFSFGSQVSGLHDESSVYDAFSLEEAVCPSFEK